MPDSEPAPDPEPDPDPNPDIVSGSASGRVSSSRTSHDVIIIGAGGAGLFCAGVAGQRGRRVLVLDHAKAPGEKIRISGGGRCNFTNLHAGPGNFLSDNPRFCISALKSFTQHDFIAMVDRYGIAWHEKTLGQLFCDSSAQQIIDMLLAECRKGGAEIRMQSRVMRIERAPAGSGFVVHSSQGVFTCASLVIATGGLSIPKIGATGFGYDIARQFGLPLIAQRPALVPFTLDDATRASLAGLAGVSLDVVVSCGKTRFAEALLFTHKGMSGPAILQISSYWSPGQVVRIDLAPGQDVMALLKEARQSLPKQDIVTILSRLLPKRLAERLCELAGVEGRIADLSDKRLQSLAAMVNAWELIPAGTEGYRTAEVTAGGVDTRALSSRSMEAEDIPGLYFIGEVMDVTGHLGGYNFQWAWSSAHAAGRHV